MYVVVATVLTLIFGGLIQLASTVGNVQFNEFMLMVILYFVVLDVVERSMKDNRE